VEPEDLTVIGHIGDLLADIYAAENGAYLHFTAMLNASGETAQSRRNGCSIRAVEVRKLGRNTQTNAGIIITALQVVEPGLSEVTVAVLVFAEIL
jgi:hypothetical protein